MIEHMNTTLYAIIDENLHGPNGMMRARLQTVFKMIQQLTYLLRTCPPHLMQQLQTPFIASWIVYRCPQSLLPSCLSDWEEMIYCRPMICNAVPTLGTFDLHAPSIQALLDATGSLSNLNPSQDTYPLIRPTEAHSQ